IGEMERDRVQEASARQLLRWAKGAEKGGQFRPRGGGNPGAAVTKKAKHDVDALRALVHAESPAAQRAAKRGRRVSIHGEEHFIPAADGWRAKVNGTSYQSPPGGTHLYRDGILMAEDHPDLTGIQGPGPV